MNNREQPATWHACVSTGRDDSDMLKRQDARVTFVLPAEIGPVSVVGDFNGWDPYAHPMRRRSNGTRSVALELTPGPHTFRYLGDGGEFFDEPEADAVEPNGYGEVHSVVVVG